MQGPLSALYMESVQYPSDPIISIHPTPVGSACSTPTPAQSTETVIKGFTDKQASDYLNFWNTAQQQKGDKGPLTKFQVSNVTGKIVVSQVPVLQNINVSSSPITPKKVKLVDYRSQSSHQATPLLSAIMSAPLGQCSTRNKNKNTNNNNNINNTQSKHLGHSSLTLGTEEAGSSQDGMAQQIIASLLEQVRAVESKMSDKIDTMNDNMNTLLKHSDTGVIPRLDSLTTEVEQMILPHLTKVENSTTAKKKGLSVRMQVLENLVKENADPELAQKWFLSNDVPAPALTVDNLKCIIISMLRMRSWHPTWIYWKTSVRKIMLKLKH